MEIEIDQRNNAYNNVSKKRNNAYKIEIEKQVMRRDVEEEQKRKRDQELNCENEEQKIK
jgi:hypothetical protein